MIEIIQHFLLQNSTILHIYKYLLDTGLHSFHSGYFSVQSRTHLHMHTPIHLHARTHYSDAHTTCEKVSLRLLPKSHQKSSQSTLVMFPPSPCFCSFRLLFYAIQNSALPISPFKFSLPALPEINLSTERNKLP